jgi:MFS family permease
VVGSNAVLAFFSQLQNAVYFLFLVRTLHLSAAMIGLLFTVSGAGGFLAALVCDRISTRFGLGRLIVLGQLTLIAGGVLLASASGGRFASSALIVAGESCFSAGMALFGVGYTSLFQFRTDDDVRGRVLGAAKFSTSAALPVAAIGGGLIAAAFSPRTALVVGAVGMALGLAAVLRPRVLGLTAHADAAAEPLAEAAPSTVLASVPQPAQADGRIPQHLADKSDTP